MSGSVNMMKKKGLEIGDTYRNDKAATAFIDPAIVLSMFMLSFVFVIVCGLFVPFPSQDLDFQHQRLLSFCIQ